MVSIVEELFSCQRCFLSPVLQFNKLVIFLIVKISNEFSFFDVMNDSGHLEEHFVLILSLRVRKQTRRIFEGAGVVTLGVLLVFFSKITRAHIISTLIPLL